MFNWFGSENLVYYYNINISFFALKFNRAKTILYQVLIIVRQILASSDEDELRSFVRFPC